MSDNPMNEAMERAARAAWFDYVDRKGYPNGLPSWDEMASPPLAGTRDDQREEITSNTRAAIAAFLRAAPVSEGMVNAGGPILFGPESMHSPRDVNEAYKVMSAQLADEIEGTSNGQ